MVDNGSMDVPEISAEWYRDVVDAAAGSPEPVQWFVGHATEGVILLLGALLVMAALSRRLRRPARPGTRPDRAGAGRPGVRGQ